MLTQTATFAVYGLEPRRVSVEVDIRPGLPAFAIVGLGDKAVRESRERVRAALLNSGFEFPQRRITANLAPAHLRKAGPGYDLGLAVGILASSAQADPSRLATWAVFGELGLDGALRPCRGALAVAEGAKRAGFEGLIVPLVQQAEAALVPDVKTAGVTSLREAVAVLAGTRAIEPPPPASPVVFEEGPDLADVRGHLGPRRALEITAAGGHNLLLDGPPGTGKTMLARRLPSILPPLTPEEAIEATRIRSISVRQGARGLVTQRPFRAPHHSISPSGLVGGGGVPAPGEATLAHLGVLFLDELSEFPRSSLEALRQPLEDGHVSIVRGQHVAIFPTQVMLVASTNPCPCGYAGAADGRCRCSEAEVDRYRRRLSGPLLDRIDLRVAVQRPLPADLGAGPGESSAAVRERVVRARARQLERLANTGATCNAQMDTALAASHVHARPDALQTLLGAYEAGHLSARGHHRTLRVARTVADLEDEPTVERRHVLVALALRGHDGAERMAA